MRPAHLFLIDPLETLNLALDSSLRMMMELARLGHEIYTCEPRHLMWQLGESSAKAYCAQTSFPSDAVHPVVETRVVRPLGSFRAVHMRKDPPFDMDYVACTWLLDTAPKTTRIYNAPEVLRALNEKLAIFRFPGEAKPAVLSANPTELLAFLVEKASGDAVLKPLDLFGGRGIVRLRVADGNATDQVLAQIREETAHGTRARLIQAFDPAIHAGEVRVFTAFGAPLAWCLKRPEAGNFLANTRAGAELLPYQPTSEEHARVTKVASELLKDGVVFTGMDLIGGYLSEINLTSPRLLTAPGDQTNYYEKLAAMVAADVDG